MVTDAGIEPATSWLKAKQSVPAASNPSQKFPIPAPGCRSFETHKPTSWAHLNHLLGTSLYRATRTACSYRWIDTVPSTCVFCDGPATLTTNSDWCFHNSNGGKPGSRTPSPLSRGPLFSKQARYRPVRLPQIGPPREIRTLTLARHFLRVLCLPVPPPGDDLAGTSGFEPLQGASKAPVLPLHYIPKIGWQSRTRT